MPLKKFIYEHGIMVANALLSIKSNEIDLLVRVFNPSDNDVKVKKNTYLACFHLYYVRVLQFRKMCKV